MNEITKTGVFLGVAVVCLAVVLLCGWSGQSWTTLKPEEEIGKPLFEEFDPLDVTRLEIVKFDEDTGEVNQLEVAQVNNVWSIPTHDGYPADAEDQLADAASSLMGRRVLSVESDRPGDHELYGVLDPDPKTLKAGAVGVGTRVTMKGKDEQGKEDQVLLAMIIGKQVEGKDDQRYVRRVGQAPVYTVAIKTDKLSTKFDDWIEEDLLKLSTWDIRQVQISSHSIDEARGTLSIEGEMRLEYDDTADPKWKMVEDMTFEQGQLVPEKMAEDEELDTDKLDDLKDALDDLKIVDVRRKPAGLSENLRTAKDLAQDKLARISLEVMGFFYAPVGDDLELFSNEGDIRCRMKDGVEYVLRFGNIAGAGAAATTEDKEGEDSGGDGLNRYIFVMAEFNEQNIPVPEYEELPKEQQKPAQGDAAQPDEAGGDAPEAKTEGDKPAGETSAAETQGEAAEEKNAADPSESKAENEPAQEKTEEKTSEAETENEPAQEKTEEKTSEGDAEGEASEEKAEGEASEQKSGEKETDEKSEIEKERERIEKENKRKKEEYLEKIAEGKKKRDELNKRFADWYYIISDEVYQKIHLSRDQIVKKKEKKEDEDGDDKDKGGDDAGADDGDKKDDTAAGADDGDKPAGQEETGATQATEDQPDQPDQPPGEPEEPNKPKEEGPGAGE